MDLLPKLKPETTIICSPTLWSGHLIDHSFVALRGVKAHTNVDAVKTSPDWRDLAPDFICHPIQPDVLAQSEDRFRLPLPLWLDRILSCLAVRQSSRSHLRFHGQS